MLKTKRSEKDRVWIQHIEKRSEEVFECEITEVGRDDAGKLRYRLKLVDGGKPGKAYMDGKWLSGDRLHDSRDECNDM